jgi:hypothetical protein
MAAPIDVPLPLGLVIADGYIVRFTALNPSTGAVVPNVVVSGVTVQVDQAPPPSAPVKNTAVFLPGPAFE